MHIYIYILLIFWDNYSKRYFLTCRLWWLLCFRGYGFAIECAY